MSTILGVAHDVREETGSYPSSIAVMVNAKDLNGLTLMGSLDEIPKDPWGRAYEYRLVNGKPWVRCLGRDGLPGGDGDDRDIIRTLNED